MSFFIYKHNLLQESSSTNLAQELHNLPSLTCHRHFVLPFATCSSNPKIKTKRTQFSALNMKYFNI
ncbi:hypothetical protein HanXRQr2_Chr03g0102211 [Helianthus annuus]|uniref:Uncharacterized protein n=1 Tax=Helianthus annuus TaxID=4232 RepID=A0A9K3JF19_HELAN|nr:hypothetical protein HanXRQr2_Chr03g0102211 [Helianthus annuus]